MTRLLDYYSISKYFKAFSCQNFIQRCANIGLRSIIIASFSILLPLMAQAQDAVEVVTAKNLEYRGQGRSPWCFAFAEEQLLKDETCGSSPDCQYNADQWAFSIFDIVLSHGEKSYKESGSQTRIQNLFNGSSNNLPYLSAKTKSLRKSQCTLEKEIFFMNRSGAVVPSTIGLYDMLKEARNVFKYGTLKEPKELIETYEMLSVDPNMDDDVKEVALQKVEELSQLLGLWNRPHMAEAKAILTDLAKASQDGESFINKVLNYSKCDDKAALPRGKIVERLLTDTDEISELLGELLEQRSVMIGICAEVLTDEENLDKRCGGHAVTVKDQEGDNYLVVDSAFFTNRTLNDDGSAWIPKEVVHLAIAKMGLHLEKTQKNFDDDMTKLEADYHAQMESLNTTELKTIVEEGTEGYMQLISMLTGGIPGQDLKNHVVTVISQYKTHFFLPMKQNEDDVETEEDKLKRIQLQAELVAQISELEITNSDDLEKIRPIITKLLTAHIQGYFSAFFDNVEDPFAKGRPTIRVGSNVTWIE